MAQIKTGTVSVTNGSNVVTGSGTQFLTDGAVVGSAFIIQTSEGIDGAGVLYTIGGSITENGFQLSSNWAGETASGLAFVVHVDMLAAGFYQLLPGDLEIKTIFNYNITKLINDKAALAALGTAAFANLTTSATDTTAGRALKVGDGGAVTNVLYFPVSLSPPASSFWVKLGRVGGSFTGPGYLELQCQRFDDYCSVRILVSREGGGAQVKAVYLHNEFSIADIVIDANDDIFVQLPSFSRSGVFITKRLTSSFTLDIIAEVSAPTGTSIPISDNYTSINSKNPIDFGLGVDLDADTDNAYTGSKLKRWDSSASGRPPGTINMMGLDLGYALDRRAQLAIAVNPVSSAQELWFRGAQSDIEIDATGWERAFGRRNILGTVSQSGGVPTGGIIEKGSNPDGSYTKYADGTLICMGDFVATLDLTNTTEVPSGMFRNNSVSIDFPETFVGNPDVIPVNRFGASPDKFGLSLTVLSEGATTFNAVWASVQSLSSQQVKLAYMAIGRWF